MGAGWGYGTSERGSRYEVAGWGKWQITWKLELGFLLAGRDFRLQRRNSAAWVQILRLPGILDSEERRWAGRAIRQEAPSGRKRCQAGRLSSPSWKMYLHRA